MTSNIMNRISIVIVLMMTITVCKSQSDYFDYAYQYKDSVCVIQNKLNTKLCFADAITPCISPDGTRLAVTKYYKTGQFPKSYVSVFDLKTKGETKLNVNLLSFSSPVWSPDNQYLVFSTTINHKITCGIVSSESKDLAIVNFFPIIGLFSPTWLPDSQHFIAHNLKTIYKFDLKCQLVDSIEIKKLLGKEDCFSSGSKFLYTPDNKYIIYNCAVVDEHWTGVIGPIEALFQYNIASKEIVRLTPKTIDCANPYIESNNTILFSGGYEKDNYSKIFRINLSDKKIELVCKNGINPTSRRK